MKPKNIVLCLDGTGNQVEENLSNVLKLYRALRKSEDQVVFYDQGVGTLKRVWTWGRMMQKARLIFGLATGLGLDHNVLAAYEFIVRNYREGKVGDKVVRDRIFIFGFSRGAHTARVLSGLVFTIGILRPDQIHLAPAALTAYKQSLDSVRDGPGDDNYEGEGMNFRRVVQPINGSVSFLGLFDTVSSVLIPNPRGYWPPFIRERLPATDRNPAVRRVRHAVSIDERRRMFRLDRWPGGQEFRPDPHVTGEMPAQDVREVWFSGFHADVGGGYKRADSGISQFPLIWMIDEAKAHGLDVFDRMARYITGVEPYSRTTEYLYPEPKPDASLHNSLAWYWRPLELLPKRASRREWPERRTLLGYYLPLGEPRCIPTDAEIHPSVQDRMDTVKDYAPENVEKRCGD